MKKTIIALLVIPLVFMFLLMQFISLLTRSIRYLITAAEYLLSLPFSIATVLIIRYAEKLDPDFQVFRKQQKKIRNAKK